MSILEHNFESLRKEYKNIFRQSFDKRSTDLIKSKNKCFNKSEIDLKNPLDQAVRDILLEFLEEELGVDTLKEYVNFCIDTCRNGYTNPTLPVVVLGDIFESLTLDGCQQMFLFVEDNVAIWKEDLFFSACKNNLLRLCNDLLRRLSRSTATVFCGRILLFLAKFFPFSERSGLNIVSEFNLENTTEYGIDASNDTSTEIETGDKKKTIVIDFTLYCKFWSLQDFFRYPTQCYDKVQWKLFCSHSTSILNTFQGLKLEYVGKNVASSEKKDIYFSKYLTSQKLLDLQLYDNNFRRFVLLQFLVLFQYLTSSVKFKSESFELKPDQKEWISNIRDKIYKLLRETPPDGEKFAEIVSNILAREEYWNAWKNDGCPEFKKLSPNTDIIEKTKNKSVRPHLGDQIKNATMEDKYYMGSSELTKLWNLCPDNLEACKGKERNFLPSLENYFSEAIDQLESVTPVKDESNLLKDSNFGWRALRLLAKRSPHFFTYSTTIMNQQSTYIEMMVRKIAHDQKGKMQETNHENHQDAEEENLFKETEEGETNEEMKPEEFLDEDNNPRAYSKITPMQLQFISENVTSDWKKLAAKLGFKPDEIQFFVQENPTEVEQAHNMLQLWFEDDEDATIENFLYIIEGLEMTKAANIIKNEFQLN